MRELRVCVFAKAQEHEVVKLNLAMSLLGRLAANAPLR
jgi:hypothetical protein